MRIFILALCFVSAFSHSAVVLQYHHIDTTTPPITSTDPEMYLAHLDYLEKAGFQVVALQDIVDTPEIGDDNRVAITFDDAYANLLDNAVPALTARNWPFTIFVATEFVGQQGYLSWEDLRGIERQGGTLANHTHSHLHMLRKLDGEADAQWLQRLQGEITKSQALLEKHLAAPARHFAYPYGEYNYPILELIDELDFVGFGQQSGAIGKLSDHRLLPRFPLSGIYANFETFKTKVHTQALPARIGKTPPVIDENPPELILSFDEPESLRLNALTCYGPGGTTSLEEKSEGVFMAKNKMPLPVGRSRYNCTMPMQNSRHFYWFSQLWINKKPDGSWYAE